MKLTGSILICFLSFGPVCVQAEGRTPTEFDATESHAAFDEVERDLAKLLPSGAPDSGRLQSYLKEVEFQNEILVFRKMKLAPAGLDAHRKSTSIKIVALRNIRSMGKVAMDQVYRLWISEQIEWQKSVLQKNFLKDHYPEKRRKHNAHLRALEDALEAFGPASVLRVQTLRSGISERQKSLSVDSLLRRAFQFADQDLDFLEKLLTQKGPRRGESFRDFSQRSREHT